MPTPFTIAAIGIGVAVGGMGVLVIVGTGVSSSISVAVVLMIGGVLSPQAVKTPGRTIIKITNSMGFGEFLIPAKLYSLAS
jgi:hypothetical protein